VTVYYLIKKSKNMLRWVLSFVVIALIAGLLGFGGIAGAAAGIAKIIFYIFIILFVASLIMSLVKKA
jgi:uncharacterized membrane protein YtjA (UPF0391 family)